MGKVKKSYRSRRQGRRLSYHKKSMLFVAGVIIFLMIIVLAHGMNLREKNQFYIKQEKELKEQLANLKNALK